MLRASSGLKPLKPKMLATVRPWMSSAKMAAPKWMHPNGRAQMSHTRFQCNVNHSALQQNTTLQPSAFMKHQRLLAFDTHFLAKSVVARYLNHCTTPAHNQMHTTDTTSNTTLHTTCISVQTVNTIFVYYNVWVLTSRNATQFYLWETEIS